MKVLQIINSLGSGGAEKLLIDACFKYIENGVDVDVLLLDGTETSFLESLRKLEQVNIISISKGGNVYNPLYILKIKPYLEEYDIIHVHLFPALYWIGLANLLSRKKHRVIVTEHNTTNRRRRWFVFKLLDRLVYGQFSKIVTISDAVDTNLRAHLKGHFEKFIKIYNGINLKEINQANPYTKESLNFRDKDKLIIQVSSFTPQKDQATLIKAIEILPANYKLILVGKGPLEQEKKDLVNRLNLNNRVFFYGVRVDVPNLLKSVDVIVLSSFYEGLSLSSIEGMASGRPFISSDVPGLTEVVEGAGLLFERGDFKSLSQQIEQLNADDDLYNETVSKCLERSKQFSINSMVKKYIELYQNCS